MACHAKIQRHICAYHNNVQQKKEESAVKEATVVDIEDIVQKGKQGRFCPFFMSRELVKDADIVFMVSGEFNLIYLLSVINCINLTYWLELNAHQ